MITITIWTPGSGTLAGETGAALELPSDDFLNELTGAIRWAIGQCWGPGISCDLVIRVTK